MMKITILLMIATIGLAQDSSEITKDKENESVTVLNLSNQGITNLKDYDFSKYPLLEDLDLSNNDIEHIPTEIFIDHVNLTRLNLSGNSKLQLPEYASLLNANIEELNLSNCNIEKLPYSIFDGLLHLKKIDLSDNPLQEEDAIQEATLTNLAELETIALPHVDELLIQEICRQNDIRIEIKSDDSTNSIQCIDVRPNEQDKNKENNEENTSENPDDEDTNNSDDDYDLEDTMDGIDEEMLSESANKENKKRQASDEVVPVDEDPDIATTVPSTNDNPESTNEGTESPNLENQEDEKTENNNNDDVPKADETQTENHLNEADEDNNMQPEEPNNGDVPADVNETQKPEEINETTPSDDTSSNTDAPNTEDSELHATDTPTEDENKNVNSNQADDLPTNPTENKPSPTEQPANVPDETVADSVDGIVKPNLEDTPKTSETDNQMPSPPAAAPPMHRSIGNIPIETNANEEKKRVSQDKSEKMQESDGQTKAAPSSESSTGTNVLVFLVIGVIIAGAAAFGYKFYKTRSYQATRTAEPVERELKEIVIDNQKANGPNASEKIVEEEPLMRKLENSVEIKEVDEGKEIRDDSNKNTAENSGRSSYDPNRSGPYMPTTTTVKPPAETESNDQSPK